MRFLLLALLALATGCLDLEVARFARMRAAASAERPAPAAAPTGAGRSCITVIGVVPVTAAPNIGDAVAEAAGAGTLRDAVVRYELRYLPPLGGWGCYAVEGSVE